MNEDDIQKKISETVMKNPIVAFVKGSPQIPMCGFSKAVMDILNQLQVPFKTVDVLEDPAVRDGIKQFTNWPTIPQVFINGEFVGGCDILKDMFESGELQEMLKSKQV